MNGHDAPYTGTMTSETHIHQNSPTSIAFAVGHNLDLPVDEAGNWPDLRNRNATEAEVTALQLKITELLEVIHTFEIELDFEEARKRASAPQPAIVDLKPRIPGTLVSLAYVPLNFARRMLDAGRDDQAAVDNLRAAEVLVRLLFSWRGKVSDQVADPHFSGVQRDEPVTTPKGDAFIPPRFFILEPPERFN